MELSSIFYQELLNCDNNDGVCQEYGQIKRFACYFGRDNKRDHLKFQKKKFRKEDSSLESDEQDKQKKHKEDEEEVYDSSLDNSQEDSVSKMSNFQSEYQLMKQQIQDEQKNFRIGKNQSLIKKNKKIVKKDKKNKKKTKDLISYSKSSKNLKKMKNSVQTLDIPQTKNQNKYLKLQQSIKKGQQFQLNKQKSPQNQHHIKQKFLKNNSQLKISIKEIKPSQQPKLYLIKKSLKFKLKPYQWPLLKNPNQIIHLDFKNINFIKLSQKYLKNGTGLDIFKILKEYKNIIQRKYKMIYQNNIHVNYHSEENNYQIVQKNLYQSIKCISKEKNNQINYLFTPSNATVLTNQFLQFIGSIEKMIEKYGKNWQKIAGLFSNYSLDDIQAIYKQYWNLYIRKTGRWSYQQNILLLILVEHIGEGKWAAISKYFSNKTDVQIRQRYCNILNPALTKHQWKRQQSLLLLQQAEKYKYQWSAMVKAIPQFNKKTDNSLRRKFRTLMINKSEQEIRNKVKKEDLLESILDYKFKRKRQKSLRIIMNPQSDINLKVKSRGKSKTPLKTSKKVKKD